MWDGVPRGGTWISPHGGTLAAFRRRSARIDRSALRAMACDGWAASRLACTLDPGALRIDDGGAMTSQSFICRVAWHEFGALSQDSFERLKSEKVALRERCRKSARGSRAR